MPRNRKDRHYPWAPARPDRDISGLPLEERIAVIAKEHNLHTRAGSLEPDCLAQTIAEYERTHVLPPCFNIEALRALGNILEIRQRIDGILMKNNGNGNGHAPASGEKNPMTEQAIALAIAASHYSGVLLHFAPHGFPDVSEVSLSLRKEIARLMGTVASTSGARELFEDRYRLDHEQVEAWMDLFGNGRLAPAQRSPSLA